MTWTISLTHYLFVAAALFTIGVVGLFVRRRNTIMMLVCIELLLLSSNILFVAFDRAWGRVEGQVLSLFVLAIAAAEVAIGLAITMLLFRSKKNIEIKNMEGLKG